MEAHKSNKMVEVSTQLKNARIFHTLYGLIEQEIEPTDDDAEQLRALYAGS